MIFLIIRELATLMTTGQHVEPLGAQRLGFQFAYPTLEPALQSILKQIEPPCPLY